MSRTHWVLVLSTMAGGWASGVAAQERHEITGTRVAIYNLAGQVTLGPAGGSALIVEVTRGGSDAARLKVEQGPIGGRETLRVIYPSNDIDYPAIGWHGNTEVRVRDDGTFGDHQRGESWRDGDRVRISNHGDFQAYADLKVSVPEGQRLEMYLAVGRLTATNVNGDLRLDASGADVTTSRTVGPLVIDVGSGSVTVSDAQGDVSLDTGSGDVDATNVRGDALTVDTGSGSATVSQSTTRVLDLDTGSGDIEVTATSAERVRLDTGSGSIRCELTSSPADLDVDTGSGGVTLTLPPNYGATLDVETGSGGVDVDFPVEARRFGSDHLTGKIGDGRGTLRVDTGSGSVRILKRAS
jgi:hypothetical protein